MFIIAILTWVSFMAIPILIFKAIDLGFNVIAFVALLIAEIGVFFAVNTKMGCQLGDFPPLIALWVFFAICFIIISIIKKITDSSNRESDGENIKSALEKLKESANQGDAEAQVKLGGAYERGDVVSQDYAEAVKWYRSAAEQGSSSGECNLGRLYMEGNGVPQDYAEAIAWLNKASHKEKEAKDLLAEIKEKVISEKIATIPSDITREEMVSEFKELRKKERYFEAEAYLVLALKNENKKALYELTLALVEDYAWDECTLWMRKAAELDGGYKDAMYWMGYFYLIGSGVPQDYAEALKWMRKAALNGNNECLEILIEGHHKYWELSDDELEIYRWKHDHDGGEMGIEETLNWVLMQGTIERLIENS